LRAYQSNSTIVYEYITHDYNAIEINTHVEGSWPMV